LPHQGHLLGGEGLSEQLASLLVRINRIELFRENIRQHQKEIEKLEEEKNNLDAYKAKKSKKLNEDLEYYSKQLKEETNRVNNRNKFLAGFREAIFEM